MKSNLAQGATLPAGVAEDLSRLGKALRAGRARRRETQKALAERLQISANTVGAAERGDPGVSAGVYASLAWAVGLPGLSAGIPASQEAPPLSRVRRSGRLIDEF
jgi:transcriptional regulator with XRE-family HTH domain